MKIKLVPVDKLIIQCESLISKSKLKELKENIEKDGVKQPITVTHDFRVLDGKVRVRIAKELGIKELSAYVMTINEEQMNEAQIIASKHHVPINKNEYRKQLLRLMAEYPDMTIKDFCQKLDKDINWLKMV